MSKTTSLVDYLPSFIQEARKTLTSGFALSLILEGYSLAASHNVTCRTRGRFGHYTPNCPRCVYLQNRKIPSQLVYNRPTYSRISDVG